MFRVLRLDMQMFCLGLCVQLRFILWLLFGFAIQVFQDSLL